MDLKITSRVTKCIRLLKGQMMMGFEIYFKNFCRLKPIGHWYGYSWASYKVYKFKLAAKAWYKNEYILIEEHTINFYTATLQKYFISFNIITKY